MRRMFVWVAVMIASGGLVRAQYGVPNAPHISAIFSPKQTIILQAGEYQRLLRYPEVLPNIPFIMLCQANDLVEFTFPDGSILRQGPNTRTDCSPATHEVVVSVGSVLVRFSPKTTIQLKNLEVTGKDCMALVTVSREGVKVISLAGELTFHDKRVKEGQMYFFNGQPELQGPFLIDLVELIRSSPIAVEFPNHPWIVASMQRSFKKQKQLKDLGLVEPSHTTLRGGGARVEADTPGPGDRPPE